MKNDSKIAARRAILFETLAIVMAPSTIYSIFYYLGYDLGFPISIIIALLITQPFLVAFIVIYRINKKHDEKRLIKWREKKEGKYLEWKYKVKKRVNNLQNSNYYYIKSISYEPGKVCVFRITFHNKVYKDALPVITINGNKLPIDFVNSYEVLCYAQKAINTSMSKFIIQSGDDKREFTNPYFISEDISHSKIQWQCKGNTEEKNIYIDENCVPHKDIGALYMFNFFVNGKLLGEYHGRYIPEVKSVVVNIGNIDKQQVINKECLIKSALDSGRKIILPEPAIFYVNNKPVKNISFS